MDNSVRALYTIADELKKIRRTLEKQTDIMVQIGNNISELNEGKEDTECQKP